LWHAENGDFDEKRRRRRHHTARSLYGLNLFGAAEFALLLKPPWRRSTHTWIGIGPSFDMNFKIYLHRVQKQFERESTQRSRSDFNQDSFSIYAKTNVRLLGATF
jgi:hypothetical protein